MNNLSNATRTPLPELSHENMCLLVTSASQWSQEGVTSLFSHSARYVSLLARYHSDLDATW